MKKILVPVDFSDFSNYALEVAAKLARKHEAEIIVLHMLGLSEAVFIKKESEGVEQAMFYMKLAEKRFETFLDQDFLEGIKVTETIHNYKAFHEINEVAKDNEADLIIMGSHGTGGIEEVFVGSNTEKVVRTSEVPVLVIKQRREDFEIKDVVFACDFKIENLKPFFNALQLFNTLGATIHLVYINLPGENFLSSSQIEKRVEEFLHEAGPGHLEYMKNIAYRNDYSVEKGVYEYSVKIDADAIAVPTHGRQGLAHFFAGSIGEDIVNHATLPVVTFKI
ncbi:universal stress protein [Aquimarina hainanensis]|uniref:Universal stress protein n=1 Tax=Aquimarina hainanensis TaxID=1578017 RepID=A0ABW5N1X3_9FLAO